MNAPPRMRVSAEAFLRFLGPPPLPPSKTPASSRSRMGVVLTPWLGSPVPWFGVAVAMLLVRKGLHPFFIWDDLEFEKDEAFTARQNAEIGLVLGALSDRGWETVRLSRTRPGQLEGRDAVVVEEAAFLNAQWMRTSAVPTPELAAERERCLARLRANAPRIAGVLRESAPDALLVPGGVYRNTGLFLHMAVSRGIDVSTFDSGGISMCVGRNAVAACFADLPATLETARSAPPEIRRRMLADAKAELTKRMAGTDKYGYQKERAANGGGAESANAVFIPLNIETDATALGLSRFFDSSWDWLTQTVAFLLTETPARVVVRQHPYEARKDGDRMLLPSALKRLFPSDRLVVHSCHEAVNSYDLLARARLVLPYVSSMGIEAAIMGKDVVMESRVYYAGMAFAPQASGKEDYFARIAASLKARASGPGPEAAEEAALAYFLATICGRIWTKFTPQPDAFEDWGKDSLESLWRRPAVRRLVEAFSGAGTVTGLQYAQYLASGADAASLFEEITP